MSGESLHHVRLVESLIRHVELHFRPARGLLLLADHHRFGINRPRTIDGFIPDLFASDLPTTFEIVGEAKTPSDMDTPRSRRQLQAFLDYLRIRPGSVFLLAVPPYVRPRAKAVLQDIWKPEFDAVSVTIIDGT